MDEIKKTRDKVKIPIYAVGGITRDRIKGVMDAGAYGIAMISGVMAKDQPGIEVEGIMEIINTHPNN